MMMDDRKHTLRNIYSFWLAKKIIDAGYFADLVDIRKNEKDENKQIWVFKSTEAITKIIDEHIESRRQGN